MVPTSVIISLEALMTQFHITKEEKIKSATALKDELHKLKELGASKVFELITTLLQDTSHDSEVVVDPALTDEFISPNRAASILHASRPFIRKLIDEGTLHAHKIGSHYKIKTSDVFALKESWESKKEERSEQLISTLDNILSDTGWDD